MIPRTPVRLLAPALVLSALLLSGTAASATVQQPGAAPDTLVEAPLARADSIRLVRSARQAQIAFERLRFRHLPWTWDGGHIPCDERVGRFCLSHGDDDSDWAPPPDPEPVVAGREGLLSVLDSANRRVPEEPWIVGQRVRYLLEAGRYWDAVDAARACAAGRHWCAALEGLALHVSAEYEEADSAFRVALELMPPEDRSQWTDLAPIVPVRDRNGIRRLLSEQADAEATFWWLADPLWSLPGNDRRTEHYARHVMDQLQDRSRTAEGLSWGADLREILLRYGSPVGWERIRPDFWKVESRVSVLTRYAPRSWAFTPPLQYVREPVSIAPGQWDLEGDDAAAEYAPVYASRFRALEHQVARFPRNGEVRVVVGYQLDSVPRGTTTDAALVVAADALSSMNMASEVTTEGNGALALTVPAGAAVMSVETRSGDATVARARYGIRLEPAVEGVLALSDVLLLGEADPLPVTLDEAIPRARGSDRVYSGERLGLFWEVHGLPPRGDTLEISIRVTRESRGWLERAAETLGIGEGTAAVRVRWQEELTGDPAIARALLLALPELPAGEYALEVAVRFRDEEPVRRRRRLRIIS